MGIEANMGFAIHVVSAWSRGPLRDSALAILRSPNARLLFDSPQKIASGSMAAQLKVHGLSAGSSLLADDLMASLTGLDRPVQYLAIASDQGNVGVFFESDGTPNGGWVLSNGV